MSLKPRQLGHVNIFVRNSERSRDWYADVLGLHTYEFRPGRAAFMSADLDQSHEIALIQVGEDASDPQQGQVGLNHMAWRMDSLEDLKELYQKLKDKGIEMDRVGDHKISIGLYIHDPDGNGIEVYYELPRSEWPRQGEQILSGEGTQQGLFPGPWDEHLVNA